MQINSKTFRLFISSTFSDFQVEREILQTKVFPDIKEYCNTKGYTFQPIDLRWGVNNEAQLDQKVLEMCIKEVQSCKTHDYPNFLIMLGDRYGWVPLANIIEKDEFELISKNITFEDKELLLYWYYEDQNQIPVSYILKQRNNEYAEYDNWVTIEDKLRFILQNSVHSLDNNIKNKYITSATESEAIEGIINYSNLTPFQQKYLQNHKQVDYKHIFGFFRDINKDTIIDDKFISNDYEKAQEFKDKVKSQLVSENILNVSTCQISKDKLDEYYLEKFILSVKEFLKRQVDLQIKEDIEKNYTNLEIEKQQQHNYLNQKLENFLGQEKILKKIEDYIHNNNNKPLIICGPSGIGKSSIMAKAIEDTSSSTDKKIIFRFIGATPNSTTTKELLNSILEELNITIEDDTINYKNDFLEDFDKDDYYFSKLLHEKIFNLKNDIVIFIDAVDQLLNDDMFSWLPDKLPLNVKIIISSLKDRHYKKDSCYFHRLRVKIKDYIEIDEFNKPIELLEILLKQQNRTLQEHQKDYFFKQYHKSNTPLYVYMAANKIQYWKSSDKENIYLASTQKAIINDYIKDLTTKHHHNKKLLQKVFGYILASKNGLSEYEILELLNTDKKFIKTIVPDTWHKNTTQELPLVIWTRLYSHIKIFLKIQNQDGQKLLYFFHREFLDAIRNLPNQRKEHENIIEATQKLIERNKENEFDSNRWSKLYILIVSEYYQLDKNEYKIFQYYDNILTFLKDEIVLKYLKYIKIMQDESIHDENSFLSKHLTNLLIYISDKYKEISHDFYIQYIDNLHLQATVLIQEKDYIAALKIEKNNLKNIEELSIFKKIKAYTNLQNIDLKKENLNIELRWFITYIKIKLYIGFLYLQNQYKTIALENNKDNYFLFKTIYENNPYNNFFEVMYYNQSIYYSMALQQKGAINETIEFSTALLKALEKKYNEKHIYLYENYAQSLYMLSVISYSKKEIDDSQKYFFKAYKIYENLLKYNFTRYSKILMSLNEHLINTYNLNNLFLESEHFYKYNIDLSNMKGEEDVDEKINTISNDLYIKILNLKKKQNQIELFFLNKRLIEYVFNLEKALWAKKYVNRLIALGGLLNKSQIDDNELTLAEKLQKEGVDICEQYMNEKDDEWLDLYTKNMNNLANTYMYLNKKEESYLLNKKNLEISTKLYKNNPDKWFRAYYYALQNMASTYFYNNDDSKEKKYKDKIKELELNPQFQLIPDVIKNKTTDRKIKLFDYFYMTLLLLGVYIFVKYVFIE